MTEAILGVLLAALLAWAVCRTVRRAKKGGGCCGEHGETEAKSSVKDRARAHYPYRVTLDIGGMTCENCARKVENALNGLEGIWATVRISDHRAVVRAKMAPDEDLLRRTVQQAGYVVLRLEK